MPTVMMQEIPMEHGLLLAAVLFALGLIGVLTRRNMVFVLMSLEIMLNAAALAFVVAGARWGQTDGQIMFLMIISLNLGIFNLLPIPLLDGGQIMVLGIEAVLALFGMTLSMAIKEKIQMAGLAIILLLMVVVMYFDISRLIG